MVFYAYTNDTYSGLLSILISLVTFYLVRFYVKVYTLPKGPFPLPILGNILIFWKTKVNQFITITELHKKYGPVFTLWLGNTPSVFISDVEILKKAFNSKNYELNGRPDIIIRKIITQNGGNDVIFSDNGPVWASLRKVAHSAVRKLAVSDKLSYLVSEVVDQTVDSIKTNEGINKPFDPKSYIYLSVFNIYAASAFGKRYDLNDKEFQFLEQSFEYFRANTNSMAITDRVPILKPFYNKTFKNVYKVLSEISMVIRKKYLERVNVYEKGLVNDFCDGLIEAKEEAIKEAKETAPYLNDLNLSLVIFNLFFTGSDNTQYKMRWIILLMANNTDMQKNMRSEVENIIGNRIAIHEDIAKCHYVNAFIAEALRFGGALGIPHRAFCDYEIDGYKLLKDSFVFSSLHTILHDEKQWPNPYVFDPKRFLTENNEFSSKFNSFTPFGIGRRICLGEKLALADLFLITVRLLQSTSDYMIVLPEGDGSANLEPNPNVILFNSPMPYKILLQNK